MSKKELKTNAMRILDRNKIPYEYETYECDEFVDGITTADKNGLPHEEVITREQQTARSAYACGMERL